MADTAIEWAEKVWNPTTGCDRVSDGCDHCYAMTMAKRLKGMGAAKYQTDGDPRTSGPGFGVATHESALHLPLTWRKPRKVFVNSMSDLFHDEVPAEFIARVFGVMSLARRHTFQVLTKRHGRMRALLNEDSFRLLVQASMYREKWSGGDDTWAPAFRWPLPNVWLGASVENQQWADIRVRGLLETPAAVHWLSCEPLLGPVDLAAWLNPSSLCHASCLPTGRTGAKRDCSVACRQSSGTMGTIDWVVAGGESGPGARPMAPAWVRSLRDQCRSADVPFLFKQWGEYGPRCTLALCGQRCSCAGTNASHPFEMHRFGKKAAGRELDGRTWEQYPERAA